MDARKNMQRYYIIIGIGVLWVCLIVAWSLAYVVAWQIGMGALSVLFIAAWADFMYRVIAHRWP